MKISHSWTITVAELKRIWNDRFLRIMAIAVVPILCILFGLIGYRSPQDIDITLSVTGSPQAEPIVGQVISDFTSYIHESKTFSVTEANSAEEARQRLDKGATRAVIILNAEAQTEGMEVIVDATDPSIIQAIFAEVGNKCEEYSEMISITLLTDSLGMSEERAKQIVSPFQTEFETNQQTEIKFFDFYASAVIVIIALALPLLLSVTSITSERSKGTVERIFASPYRRSEIIVGKMLAYSVLALLFTILIIATLRIAFDVALGNIGLALLLAILVGINAVIFGLLLSAITRTESESILLGIMCLLVFSVLMTYIFPWETMHPVIKYVSYLVPYTYAIQAIRHINLVGWGFSDVWLSLVILLGFIVVQGLIATRILRREII